MSCVSLMKAVGWRNLEKEFILKNYLCIRNIFSSYDDDDGLNDGDDCRVIPKVPIYSGLSSALALAFSSALALAFSSALALAFSSALALAFSSGERSSSTDLIDVRSHLRIRTKIAKTFKVLLNYDLSVYCR